MLETEEISATSLADEVTFRLQEDIFLGALPPGTRLFQDELCARYRVSRTPIREALNRLAAQGLVITQPHRGTMVRRVTRQELREDYAVRAELEGFAAELAAAAMDVGVIAELDRAQQEYLESVGLILSGVSAAEAPRLNSELVRGNTTFHRIIHEAAGNRRLAELIERLQGAFPKDYVWRALTDPEQIVELNVNHHRAIRDALAAGDGVVARRCMTQHVLHAWTLFDTHLQEHGFWDEQLARAVGR